MHECQLFTEPCRESGMLHAESQGKAAAEKNNDVPRQPAE